MTRTSRPLGPMTLVLFLLAQLALAAPAAAQDADSWLDGLNRGSREFNFWVFDHVLEPSARGYNYVVPKWGQQRIQNLFENLERPRDIVNSLLQGKGRRAGNHLAAFLVNTTAGLGGMFVLSDRFLDIEPPETPCIVDGGGPKAVTSPATANRFRTAAVFWAPCEPSLISEYTPR